MRFPANNKIPWATIVYEKGKKVADVIQGLPCDMDFSLSRFHGKEPDENHVFLEGQKPGARPILAMVNRHLLTFLQREELGLEKKEGR